MKNRAFNHRKNKIACIGDTVEIVKEMNHPIHGIIPVGKKFKVEYKQFCPEIAGYTVTNDYYLVYAKEFYDAKLGINSEWYKVV